MVLSLDCIVCIVFVTEKLISDVAHQEPVSALRISSPQRSFVIDFHAYKIPASLYPRSPRTRCSFLWTEPCV